MLNIHQPYLARRKAIDTFQFYLCHTYKLEIEF